MDEDGEVEALDEIVEKGVNVGVDLDVVVVVYRNG